jgi:phytoene synthase
MLDRAGRVHRNASRLIRTKARTFYLASLFLPAAARRDVHVVYAYCRTLDDLVDEPPEGWCRRDILGELDRWEAGLNGADGGRSSLLTQLLRVADRHGISRSYLHMLIEGARFDLTLGAIETREQLLHYSVLMAGSVGMVMAHILGTRDARALEAASALGVAMQLTNVLRDVGEDSHRGRVYLPGVDLAGAGCCPDTLSLGLVTPGLRRVMVGIMAEARDHYARGMLGIPFLDPSAQFSVHLAARLYARILDKIEDQGFDVFTRRAHLGMVEKWRLAVPTYVRHRQLLTGR